MAAFAREEMERHRGMDRKDILRIEHLIRKGKRQLDLFAAAETTGVQLRGEDGANSSSGAGSSSTSSSSGTGSSAAAAVAHGKEAP